MRNRLLAFGIMAGTVFSILGMPQSQAASDINMIFSRQKAVEAVKDNSPEIWKMSESARFAKEDYDSQVSQAKGIDTLKMFLYTNPYTEDDIYYYFDAIEQMQMRFMKEFYPEQMKYVWEAKLKYVTVTENTMANAADNLFSGLYSTYQSKQLAQQTLEMEKKVYERAKVQFQNGLITKLDLEASQLDLEAAGNALAKAGRDYENVHRQYNALAGLPVDFQYNVIGTPWAGQPQLSISEEQAVTDALANRVEIWDIKKQIEVTEKQMEIYRHRDVYKFHADTKEDYRRAQDNLDNLKLSLSEKEYRIEKEIRQAYQRLHQSYLELELSKLNLAKQKNQLETISTQYLSGLIPVSAVEQMEQGIRQLELAVNINLITTLNQQDKFNRAISAGPGYESEGEVK